MKNLVSLLCEGCKGCCGITGEQSDSRRKYVFVAKHLYTYFGIASKGVE